MFSSLRAVRGAGAAQTTVAPLHRHAPSMFPPTMQLQSPADADTALQQLLQSKFMAHLDEARSGMCTTGAAAPPGAEPAALALAAPSEPSPLLRPAGDEPPIKRARRSRDGEAGPIAGQAAAAARSCGDASEPAADEGQAELPAALAELERSWRALEHVPDPARVTAAGVRRLLDLACAAFREDVAGSPFDVTAQPSTLLTGGASGDATRLSAESLSALLDFCERQLVRRPTSLRGAGARVYDMQAQLRIGIAGLRGGEMSAAMYRETKKVVTMLGERAGTGWEGREGRVAHSLHQQHVPGRRLAPTSYRRPFRPSFPCLPPSPHSG
jgi:hypothetical protein